MGGSKKKKGGKICLDQNHTINPSSQKTKWLNPERLSSVILPLMLKCKEQSWLCFWIRSRTSQVPQRLKYWAHMNNGSVNGEKDGRKKDSTLKTNLGQVGRGFFPPQQITQIKALACELPAKHGQPLSRLFIPDIRHLTIDEKIVSSISCATIWRILDNDALKPWRKRSWIYHRDPNFYKKASVVLDLYQGIYKGKKLGEREYVICADEKTGMQVLGRKSETRIASDRRGQRVEHEYKRLGTWAYLVGWDIFRARVIGRVDKSVGITPFMKLVEKVMEQPPYRFARRVFWLVDNGSSHHPSTFPERLSKKFPNAIAIMLPVHASWLNQVEIYLSILQRKVLTPNEFKTYDELPERTIEFEKRFNLKGQPFKWNFTSDDLKGLIRRLSWNDLTIPKEQKDAG